MPYIVQPPKLVTLTPDIVKKLDAFHQQSLHEHLASNRGFDCYLDRLYYEPRQDTWAGPQDWLQTVVRALRTEQG
jgi:hypothetical protein